MKSLLESPWFHVVLVILVSSGFESLFVHHAMNLMDEGWPLIAARGLHEGGTLYREVFWVFPPGHLLPAWIATALDPPGIVLARIFYAAFTVALCVALYLVGRRMMPAQWALLGALMLAIAAAPAHRYHVLFGYRYLVFAVLALLAFSQRIRTGELRWMTLAGVAAGVCLVFRLTPAFAVSLGVAVAITTLSRSPRDWLRDGLAYAAGLLVVVLPVVACLATSVGLEVLWREVVVRPVVMTDLQSLPMPALEWRPKHFTRRSFIAWGAAVQFRLYLVLYAVYLGALLLQAWRAYREQRAFDSPLLLAFAVFGGVFFVRTLGRSDPPHLYSAIPPVCLLLAHALWKLSAWRPRAPAGARLRPRGARAQVAVALAGFAFWAFFMGGDVFLDPEQRGQVPVTSLAGRIGVNSEQYARLVDRSVELLREHAGPDDVVLDLSASPLLQVIADRRGPGHFDLVMPGTFLDDSEELAFISLLEKAPPAVVVWPERHFDEMPERGLVQVAPKLARWVLLHYERGPQVRFGKGRRTPVRYTIMLPKQAGTKPADDSPTARARAAAPARRPQSR